MNKIKIEKTIFVRDKYSVKRQAFIAGEEVDAKTYYATLASNAVINPEDLPEVDNPREKLKYSLSVSAPPKEKKNNVLETKVLDAETVVREELPPAVQEEAKQLEGDSAVPNVGEAKELDGVEDAPDVDTKGSPADQTEPTKKRGRKKKDE